MTPPYRFRRSSIMLAVLASAGVASRAPAQQPAVDTTGRRRPVSVVIFAEASAREVRFTKQPTLQVRLSGGLDSVRLLERRNLPSPVVAGTTYKDVYVAVEIFGRVAAECLTRAATSGAKLDCAALEMRGAASRAPTDTSNTPRS